jgi:hypothetical protein
MAIDPRAGFARGNSDSTDNAAAVVPSDSTDLTYIASALHIGVGGTVMVNTPGGQTNVPFIVQSGQLLSQRVTRVLATGTTATGIVAKW